MTDSDVFERKIFEVRGHFECGRIDLHLLEELYQKYNPTVGDVQGFVVNAISLFPKLNCGLACVYLRCVFPDLEIVQGSYRENNHTFCLFNKTTVVDITADQYGGPKVYTGLLQEPWVKIVGNG